MISRRIVLGCLVAALLGSASPVLATDKTFNVASGDWLADGNWLPPGVPAATDNVTIPAGKAAQLNAAAATSVANFTLSGGTLSGSGTLEVAGTLTWTAGMMTGSGTTEAEGGLTIATTTAGVSLGRTLRNDATASWSGAFPISINDGSRLLNAAGATFTIQTAADFNLGGAFENEGTLVKMAGSGDGATVMHGSLNNSGAVTVMSGTLGLAGGGAQTGTFTVAAGARLRFDAGTHTLMGASISGPGAVEWDTGNTTFSSGTYDITGSTTVSGGTHAWNAGLNVIAIGDVRISGGVWTLSSGELIEATSYTQTGGTLTGTDAITVQGMTVWMGGTMAGSGTTSALGGLAVTTNTTTALADTRTLENGQTGTWAGMFPISIGAGATFANLPTATFTIQTSADFNSTGSFNNQGTVVKVAGSGDGATNVNGAFNNSGAVMVNSGTLNLAGGGAQTGTFAVASGAHLRFGGGTHALTGVSLSGMGTVDWGGGTTIFSAGSYDVTGTTMVSGGSSHTWNADVDVIAVGDMVVSGGALVLNSGEPIQPTSYTQSGGTLSGSDTVTVLGLLSWSGGTMAGSGTTNAPNGLLATTVASASLADSRTLNNGATMTWSGAFPINIGGGATLVNLPSGTVSIQTSADVTGTGIFDNQGTVLKMAGSGDGVTSFAGAVHNSGAIDIQGGALDVSGGFMQTAGSTRLDVGTLISRHTIEITGGRLIGNGAVTGNGSVVVAGAGEVSPGLSPGTTGIVAITGAYAQHAGGVLTVELGGHVPGIDFDQLTVSGAAALGGALAVHLIGGFAPALGDTFEIMTFGSRAGDFDRSSSLAVSLVGNTATGFQKVYGQASLTLKFGQEVCDDGQDNDGDGLADCADPKCAAFPPCALTPTAMGTTTAASTPTPTASASVTGTPAATQSGTPPASATGSPSPTATAPTGACVGDCNGNLVVTVDELIRGVNIALGSAALSDCPVFDANDNHTVEIAELISAVANALDGCPGAPTPTRSGGATPGPGSPAGSIAGASSVLLDGIALLPSVVSAVVNGIEASDRAALIGTEVVAPGDGACPLDGGASKTGSLPFLTVMLHGCKVAARGGSVTFDGSFSLQFTMLSLAVEMQFADADGNPTVHASAHLGGTVMPTMGGSCYLTAVALTILDGHLTAPSPNGQDLRFTGTQVKIDNITFSDDCVPELYRLTFNGTVALTGAGGAPIPVSLASLVVDVDDSGSATMFGLTGAMTSDCFGGAADFTTQPLLSVPPGSVCPVAGVLMAQLPTGTAAVRYQADGSVAIDGNGDGVFEQTAPTCLDPRLLMCAS